MSLYYETADMLANKTKAGGSLKSRIYNSKTLKNPPAKVYALAAESTKWAPVLKEVIDNSGMLLKEKKLNSRLAVLLVHDLLLTKKGVAAPGSHPLKVAVLRHKARLNAEFTRLRIKRGYTTIDDFRHDIENGYDSRLHAASNPSNIRKLPHPRWVRINTLEKQENVADLIETHSKAFKRVSSLSKVIQYRHPRFPDIEPYCLDVTVPDLYAFPPGSHITKAGYDESGWIIYQDKASCFPALLLRDAAFEGDVIDACAAPGNKTTHLAALQRGHGTSLQSFKNQIHAFERDQGRSATLRKMVKVAKASHLVSVHGGTDFLTVDPRRFPNVTAILLDPSCSGSGIIDREDVDQHSEVVSESLGIGGLGRQHKPEASKKRKFEEIRAESNNDLQSRLAGLAAFQLKLIVHAMRFEGAVMISYSTCSIHPEENEHVILRALTSDVAKEHGWKLLRRDDQFEGLKRWHIRGDVNACQEGLKETGAIESLDAEIIADSCIRCERYTEEGTMGFFVAGFTRAFSDPEKEERFQRTKETYRSSDIKYFDRLEMLAAGPDPYLNDTSDEKEDPGDASSEHEDDGRDEGPIEGDIEKGQKKRGKRLSNELLTSSRSPP